MNRQPIPKIPPVQKPQPFPARLEREAAKARDLMGEERWLKYQKEWSEQ